MPPKLFFNDMDSLSRAVLMTSSALGIDLELEEVDIFTKEKNNENLLRVNPEYTVPTLVLDDKILCNTIETITYLVEKYGENDKFYPKDEQIRTLIDQKLNFNDETLFPRINAIILSVVVENEKEISTDKISAIKDSYKTLDAFLEHKDYLIGDCLTIADICCVASISTSTIIIPISMEKYPNLSMWYRNFKNLNYYEETNGKGLNKLDALVELKLGRPRIKEICD